MYVIKRNGRQEPVTFSKIENRIKRLCTGLQIEQSTLAQKVISNMKTAMKTSEIDELAATMAASKAVYHPDYLKLAARIEVSNLHSNTTGDLLELWQRMSEHVYLDTLCPLIDPTILPFVEANAKALQAALDFERDFDISYFGLKTLQRAYLIRTHAQKIIERPGMMWMRVAIGLHHPDLEKTLETYCMLSRLEATHATPTLFNAATMRPQLSSCFLLSMKDDSIDGIFDTLKQCATISKYAGGIGLACSNIRSKGSYIKGTNGVSNGIAPMLRVFNNCARYVDQGGGRRKGSFAIYLEPWHACIYDFLELKLPGGKMEARAFDLFYGLWICDLFMQRVVQDTDWSLMCPHECPGLTTTYGDEFDILYTTYEAMPGKVKRRVKARDLWFKILTAQVESGTPYMLYKDAVNRKSNQKNVGVIKSSNLCTEITLYTDENEVAVCNLASICLPKMLDSENRMNYSKLGRIVEILTRNLDNVIDRNFYPIPEAKTSNLRHRPVGIGIQGLADIFMQQRIPFESKEALELSDDIMECIYYHALKTSCQLAKERGQYETFEGSPASKGILQYDMWDKTEEVEQGKDRYDWQALKKDIVVHGLRNSMLLSPMPTASTAQICGNTEGIEPLSSNLYTRHTLAGNFVVVNKYLVNDLIDRNLWNSKMQTELIKSKGSVQHIDQIPEELKQIYKTTWEIKQRYVIDHAARRGKYICQSQSMNLYFPQPTANQLSSAHIYAWKQGLKTGMYYLRAKPANEALNFSQEEEECESCGS